MQYIKIYSLLAIYLSSCVSLVIDFHYCGGELETIALYQVNEDGCCGEHEGDEKENCCDDEFLLIDTDNNEEGKKYAIANIDIVKSISSYTPLVTKMTGIGFVVNKMVIPINHAPPNNETIPLFIRNRILLI